MEALAARAPTASRFIFRGIWPELRPLFTNYMFFYFEASVRQAPILGIVGAGGIGLEFILAIKHFKYPEAMTIVLSMLLLVVVTDRTSAFVRQRLLVANCPVDPGTRSPPIAIVFARHVRSDDRSRVAGDR